MNIVLCTRVYLLDKRLEDLVCGCNSRGRARVAFVVTADSERVGGQCRLGHRENSSSLAAAQLVEIFLNNFANRGITMPLKKGSTQSVVSSNIKTLVDDWKKDGSIGTSHPQTKKKAIKQAVAIALDKAGKSRNT